MPLSAFFFVPAPQSKTGLISRGALALPAETFTKLFSLLRFSTFYEVVRSRRAPGGLFLGDDNLVPSAEHIVSPVIGYDERAVCAGRNSRQGDAHP